MERCAGSDEHDMVRRFRVIVLAGLLVSLCLTAGGTSARNSVALVPIGNFSEPSLSLLANHFRHKLHMSVRVRAAVPLPAGAYNGARKQFVGEKLLSQLERAYPRVIVLGVTNRDIYMATKSFRSVFSTRDGRAAVVSSARMDPRFFGVAGDAEVLYSRIEKMTTKDIGLLALGRHESRNPRSVLYTPILSVDDLDFMTEDFAPRPYAADKRAWLAGANASCNKASAAQLGLRAIPIRTTDDILAVLGKAIAVEQSLLATIDSLQAMRSDRALAAKLRSTFATAVSVDETTLTALTAHWNQQRFKQWARDNASARVALRVTSLRLGSKACAAYFGA
jgi:predicted Zn-dependent protease